MLICKSCHSARQDRDHQEHQPLQFTGYETTGGGCPDCSGQSKGGRYEYMTAHELLQELTEAKEKIEELELHGNDWQVAGFYGAGELLHAVTLGNRADILRDPEVMLQVLEYAAG